MKDKELMRGLRWSLFVHTVLLLTLLHAKVQSIPAGAPERLTGDSQAQAQQNMAQEVQVEIIDPPKKSDEIAKASDKDDGVGLPAHLNDECPDFFGGIGVTESYNWNDPGPLRVTITEVHRGYPAEKAGIKVGDELLNSMEIRGEIGTKVTVRTLRDGVPMSYEIVRDKICTEKAGKEEP